MKDTQEKRGESSISYGKNSGNNDLRKEVYLPGYGIVKFNKESIATLLVLRNSLSCGRVFSLIVCSKILSASI